MVRLITAADAISLINAELGFLAIVILISGVFTKEIGMRLSFSLILLAVLADGLDGIIARKTRHGKLGEYLEAMADMTSLAIAPGIFLLVHYSDLYTTSQYHFLLVCVILLFFLFCSIVRLSSFHILKEKKNFVGLPASASTIIILLLVFFNLEHLYLLVAIVILSILMLSPIRFPKPKLKINGVAAILILLTIVLWDYYNNTAPILLLISLLVYIIAGPIYVKYSVSSKGTQS